MAWRGAWVAVFWLGLLSSVAADLRVAELDRMNARFHQRAAWRAEFADLPARLIEGAERLARDGDVAADAWLTLAGEGLDPAAGEGLDAAVRLDAASAAALNAVLTAVNGSDKAAGLTLLAKLLARAGDKVSASLVVGMLDGNSRRNDGELAKIRPPASPRWLDEPGEPLAEARFGTWTVGCDNGLMCRAFVVVETANGPVALVLTRFAGPGAPPRIEIVLGGTGPAGGGGVLRFGRGYRESVRFAERPDPHWGRPAFIVPASRVERILDRLATGDGIVLASGTERVVFPAAGAADAFRHIDAIQGRAGSTQALVARGRKTESRVPLAPAPRQMLVPAVTIRAWHDPVPEDVRAFWRHVCSEATLIERLPDGGRPRALSLADGTAIWLLPCRSGAYRMQYQVFYRLDGNLQSLTLPYRHNGIEPKTRLLDAPVFRHTDVPIGEAGDAPLDQALPLFLVEEAPGGGSGGPGRRTVWAWTGKWFERVREERLYTWPGLAIPVTVYRDRLVFE